MFVRSQTLKWNIPWWKFSSYSCATSPVKAKGLFLCGLDRSVFIYPLRVLRQMSFSQRIPSDDTSVHKSNLIKGSDIQSWAVD